MPNNHPTNKNLSKVDFSFSDLHKQKGENPEHFSNCGEAKTMYVHEVVKYKLLRREKNAENRPSIIHFGPPTVFWLFFRESWNGPCILNKLQWQLPAHSRLN